jgi:cob(I)alamin adenosyltransferase
MRDVLAFLQHRLYRYAGMLATAPTGDPEDADPALVARTDEDIAFLERAIDRFEETSGALDRFVLPGGSALAAQLFVARSVVRRAERRVAVIARSRQADAEAMRFLNRLSDTLFAAARYANHDADRTETQWQPDALPPTV